MYEDLKGKTAFVTGAGKKTGIGYTIAGRLAACGCDIVIADHRPALEAAFASGKTVCINVAVDPSVISPGSVALVNLGGLPEIGGLLPCSQTGGSGRGILEI